ncbi:ParB/RepB/Spo0J family partition protein [uncultured Oscillibacter sp.]|uniref:ParB/RepB/Spo0J family partition protein n=1 Tax=uncultured Oscillibacter sp. TaxID=876091 RepID=UPI0025DC2D3B|nr:ParB/RepB/Spo0J family partition protein [uncultured Oscillibacter sp.]
MKKLKLDISSFEQELGLNNVPKLDTSGREQIQYIALDQIDDDPNNFYELGGIDELAANIELCGLQQPIRVRAGKSDRYIIVSGHRRRSALRKLVEDGRAEFGEAPCIVEQAEGLSAAMQELRLIYANADTRKLTSSEQSRQAERVEALLYQLKEEGVEFPGRMRDHVSEACKLSKSKLARLKVIRENLLPLWADLYKKDKLNEDAAYELAKLPEDYQRKLYDAQQSGDLHLYGRDVESWGKELAALDAISCPKKEQCCTNADNMWNRRLKKNDWSSRNCDGRYRKATCCKGCQQLYSCKFACSHFAEEIAKHKADAKVQKKTEREEQQAKEAAHIAKVAASWAHVRTARKLAKITMSDFIRGIYAPDKPQSASYTDWREKDWANREKGEGLTTSDRPFGADILNNDELLRAADVLGCSLDYLLGRVDDPQPFIGAWTSAHEERPDEGRFLFVCDAFGLTQPSVYWNGDYMDATSRSTANNVLQHIHYWMYQPALPGGMKHQGQETLEEIMRDRGAE